MNMLKKEKNKNIHLVIFSNKNYDEHYTNVFKECLEEWTSDDNSKFLPKNWELNVSYIHGDYNRMSKIFFVSTTTNWLKSRHLEYLIDKEDYSPETYMRDYCYVFPPNILPEKD